MRRVAGGDRSAFAELVERHQALVFRVAYRFLGRRPDAEDVVQDTFLRLYAARDRYRATAPFRAYLLTITTRLCLNRKARASERQESLSEPDALERAAGASEGADAERRVLRHERELAVREAIAALPAEQRLALVLFRFEGLSYEEIAAAMKRSPSSVTSLLWRARERLRRALREIEDEEPRKIPTGRRLAPDEPRIRCRSLVEP